MKSPKSKHVVDRALSEASHLTSQNGFILRPSALPPAGRFSRMRSPRLSQGSVGYICTPSLYFAIDPFTRDTSATLVVPGSHQRIRNRTIPRAQCRSRSMRGESLFVFDSTLWHAAGRKHLRQDRLAINHQFTRSFFKQQIDYVRALGDAGSGAACAYSAAAQMVQSVVTNLNPVLQPPDQAIVSRAKLVLRKFVRYLKARHETIAFKRICLFCKNV